VRAHSPLPCSELGMGSPAYCDRQEPARREHYFQSSHRASSVSNHLRRHDHGSLMAGFLSLGPVTGRKQEYRR
jgi:hypothetical protein